MCMNVNNTGKKTKTIFSHIFTRNTTDRWWKLIRASWVRGRSGLYFTASGRSHSATPCFRLRWRHVWPNGTAVRKSETYLSPRLVCMFSGFMCEIEKQKEGLLCCVILCARACVHACVQCFFLFYNQLQCNQRLQGKGSPIWNVF